MPNFKISKHHIAIAAILLVLSLKQAIASSDDTWEEFRNEAEQSCTKAAIEMMNVESIKVDPFGSQSFGFAIISGFQKGNKDK